MTGYSEEGAPNSRGRGSHGPAAALSLEGLSKSYDGGKSFAVQEVNLDIDSGEFVTFLGPSGSGKTSTLRMIAGFEVPTRGEIRLDGNPVSRLSPAERGFGMVFQDYALFPHMTVAHNVEYGLRLRGVRGAERGRRVAEMLELVQLGALGHRYPGQLSGGQQQRVSMARAIAFGPRLLLMDEPLGALDRQLRLQMEGELRRLHRELGTTILYVTHDQDEALALSDRIAIMRDGRLIEFDRAQTIFERPRTAFAAEFVSRCNVLRAKVARSGSQLVVSVLGNTIPVDATTRHGDGDGDVWVGVRRDAFRLDGDHSFTVDSLVRSVVYRGEFVDATCETVGGTLLQVRFPANAASAVVPDRNLRMGIEQSGIRILESEVLQELAVADGLAG